MFDIYFPFMKVFHVDLLLTRHHFLSIPYSTAAASMVSPTRIMLELCLLRENNYWTLSVMGYIYKTSYYDLRKK